MAKHLINSKTLKDLRKRTLEITYHSQKSNIGSCLSSIEFLSYMYLNKIDIHAIKNNLIKRDRFILSKGQCAPAFYAVLEKAKIIKKNSANTYRKINSLFQTHPHVCLNGVEYSSGSLGQGLSYGCGVALGLKKFNINSKTYVYVGDGEMQEGQIWESIMFAGHHKLKNLCLIIDENKIQDFEFIAKVINNSDLDKRIKSFNWKVIKCNNGNSIEAINKSYNKLFDKNDDKMPKCLILNTIKGFGIKSMENKPAWSKTNSLTKEQFKKFENEI